MPAIRRNVTADTENALEGLKFSVLNSPALVSLYGAGATQGDNITFSIGDMEVVVNAPLNVQAAAGVIDTDRDAILIQERVPAGKMFLSIDLTTEVDYLLIIEPVV